MKDLVYFDNNATTRIDPRVLEEMMPFLTDIYGNASSNHELGVTANQSVKNARNQLADLLNCDPNEIIFTSGATEAINLAIKGVAEEYKSKGRHVITVSTEHSAVLDVCKHLESKGFEITYLPVESSGTITLSSLEDAFRSDTILVCVMFANNETGVIQPIKAISEMTHQRGAVFMTDATQAVGKISIDVDKLGIDLLCFSGHKFYGPKGIGGLYVRSKRPGKVKLYPLLHGGGHERGFRSGTLNVPGIVGIGKAAEISQASLASDTKLVSALRDLLESELLAIENTFVNGQSENRLYNTTNICFVGADADAIMVDLVGVMVSNGSACTSNKVEPSHVLKAMGRTDHEAYSSIRFSLGRFNSRKEVDDVVKLMRKTIENLRVMAK